MTKKTFMLVARVSTESPPAIKLALGELVPTGSIAPTMDTDDNTG